MQDVRPVVRALLAIFFAAAVSVFFVPGARAAVAVSPRTLTVSITAMSPQWATAKSTVTISGTVSNHTGSAISGLVVQAETTGQIFGTRSQLNSFADGVPGAGGSLFMVGSPDELGNSLPSGASEHWSVSFPAAGYYSKFGVYPIQVQAATSAYQATANTLMPYWPGKGAAVPLQVSWILPLIDTPQQGACGQTLATQEVARSVAPGGRLSTLLNAAKGYAQSDQVTWAVDPALLSDVSVMTHKYFTGGDSVCKDRNGQNPSTAAATWLSSLRAETAGQPAFLTPYANVDVAALSHDGFDADIKSAYSVGRQTASQILPGTFGANGNGTANGAVLAAAWPAGGVADAQVLNSLADDGGIGTVVLKTGELPPTSSYDTALARTATSSGKPVSALLADSEITSLLGSATASSPASAQFAVSQDFLAETAMIVAEGPNAGRSLVVAPPTGWDPSATEAATLLRLTGSTPWLSPTALGTLATEAAQLKPHRLPASRVSHAELPLRYIDRVATMDISLDTYADLLYNPSKPRLTSLAAAAAVTESVAWRGAGLPGGSLALTKLGDFLTDEMNKVQILASKPILLAGASGTTLVSVQNLMTVPVKVRVYASTAPESPLSVGSFDTSPDSLRIIEPGQTNTVRMPLHSTEMGTTTLQLQLHTENGSPLGAARNLSVEATRLGRTLLVIIGAALGVLVLASAFRLRRKRLAAGKHAADATEHAGTAEQQADAPDEHAGTADQRTGTADDRVEAGGAG